MSALLLTSPDLSYQHLTATTDDGVDLAVQVVGDGPAVLFANGIGVTTPGLDFIADHLRDRHRVICWDYRGAGRSATADLDVEFSLERHAKDGLAVLDAVGETSAAVLGWSLGVPVGLEMIRQAPDRISAYGALFGSAGPAFRSASFDPVALSVESVLKGLQRFPQLAQALLELAVRIPAVAWTLLTTIKFMSSEANREIFEQNVLSVARTDKKAYFTTMSHLLPHDARDVLPTVECPVLIVAGTGDWLTPPRAAREMANLAPHAELVIIDGATHFGVIEHGPELWDPIDRLLAQVG